MRQNNNQRRGRSRNNQNRRPSRNQSFDSNGPSVRLRGTAAQLNEKYQAMARDAMSAGDRVMVENYHQHADHYYRVMISLNPLAQRDEDGQPEMGDMDDMQPHEGRGRGDRSQSPDGQNQAGQIQGGQNQERQNQERQNQAARIRAARIRAARIRVARIRNAGITAIAAAGTARKKAKSRRRRRAKETPLIGIPAPKRNCAAEAAANPSAARIQIRGGAAAAGRTKPNPATSRWIRACTAYWAARARMARPETRPATRPATRLAMRWRAKPLTAPQ